MRISNLSYLLIFFPMFALAENACELGARSADKIIDSVLSDNPEKGASSFEVGGNTYHSGDEIPVLRSSGETHYVKVGDAKNGKVTVQLLDTSKKVIGEDTMTVEDLNRTFGPEAPAVKKAAAAHAPEDPGVMHGPLNEEQTYQTALQDYNNQASSWTEKNTANQANARKMASRDGSASWIENGQRVTYFGEIKGNGTIATIVPDGTGIAKPIPLKVGTNIDAGDVKINFTEAPRKPVPPPIRPTPEQLAYRAQRAAESEAAAAAKKQLNKEISDAAQTQNNYIVKKKALDQEMDKSFRELSDRSFDNYEPIEIKYGSGDPIPYKISPKQLGNGPDRVIWVIDAKGVEHELPIQPGMSIKGGRYETTTYFPRPIGPKPEIPEVLAQRLAPVPGERQIMGTQIIGSEKSGSILNNDSVVKISGTGIPLDGSQLRLEGVVRTSGYTKNQGQAIWTGSKIQSYRFSYLDGPNEGMHVDISAADLLANKFRILLMPPTP